MTDYHKKTKKELIDELKACQKECARLAANCKDDLDIQTEYYKEWRQLYDKKEELLYRAKTAEHQIVELKKQNKQIERDLAAQAIRSIKIIEKVMKV